MPSLTTARLWPARCRRPSCFGRSRTRTRRTRLRRHAVGSLIDFHQYCVVFLVVFREQGSHFTQLLRRLLEHLNLLSQRRVLGLLLPQYLMNILHATPCGECKEEDQWGSTVIPAAGLLR